jgi:hypothetical protein
MGFKRFLLIISGDFANKDATWLVFIDGKDVDFLGIIMAWTGDIGDWYQGG